MSSPAITVENLSKHYRLGVIGATTLRESVENWWHRIRGRNAHARMGRIDPSARPSSSGEPQDTDRDLWALKDVSFTVNEGEVLGVIGKNGAGKSTLLKILTRITEPTSGRAVINGRMASLLEVGTGFHPELTGRENIFLNGAVLGMKKAEIARKFDEIVDFSGISRFIDTPVKRYSSGMYVRLAFAVAAHLDPEILLIDEVLAVGDADFQKRCLGKMKDVAGQGRTVLFVSHNMSAVLQLTSRAILLKSGRIECEGEPTRVVEQYIQTNEGNRTLYDVENTPRVYHGSGHARLVELRFEREIPIFRPDEDIKYLARVRAVEPIQKMRFSMTVFTADGSSVGSCFGPDCLSLAKGDVADFQVALPCPSLAPGHYQCGLAIGQGSFVSGQTDFDVVYDVLHFEIRPHEGEGGTLSVWTRNWGPIIFRSLVQQIVS